MLRNKSARKIINTNNLRRAVHKIYLSLTLTILFMSTKQTCKFLHLDVLSYKIKFKLKKKNYFFTCTFFITTFAYTIALMP